MSFINKILVVLACIIVGMGLYYSIKGSVSEHKLQKLYLKSAERHVLTRTGVQLNTSIVTVEHDGCWFIIAESKEGIAVIHHSKCPNHD